MSKALFPAVFLLRIINTPFRQLSPYAGISRSHPLFTLESSRVRRLLNWRGFLQLSIRVTVIIVDAGLLFWLLAANADMRGFNRYAGTATSQLTGWLFIISLGLDFILDFACMTASVSSFSGEVIARRWDLLRLTPYTAGDWLAVKHSAARLRVWRMTMIVVVVRLILVIMFLLDEVLNAVLYAFPSGFNPLWSYLPLAPFALAYVIEPLWRSRVMTLLGLTISIRVRNNLSLVLSAIGTVLAFWIVQIVVIGFIFWFTGWAINRYLPSIFNSFSIELVIWLASIYVGAVFYLFYAVIWKMFHNRLIRRIDRAEA